MDISGMHKAITEILGQAWSRGRKCGYNEAVEIFGSEDRDARKKADWVLREFTDKTGKHQAWFCSECDYPRSQVSTKFYANCGCAMKIWKGIDE